MIMNLDLANLRQTDMLREAEKERLAKSVTNHRRPSFHFRLPFSVKWLYEFRPAETELRECVSPCA